MKTLSTRFKLPLVALVLLVIGCVAMKNARQNAAESHYQKGLLLMEEDPREAALAFRRAETFVPGYKDCPALYKQAKEAATQRIMIALRAHGGGVGNINPTSQLIADLRGRVSEFIKLVSWGDLQQEKDIDDMERSFHSKDSFGEQDAIRLGKHLGVHVLVFGTVRATVNETPERRTHGSNSGAEWDVYRRVRSVQMTADIQVLDVQDERVVGTVGKQRTVTDVIERASWSGNAGSVPDHVKALSTGSSRRLDSAWTLARRASNNLVDALAEELAVLFK